MDYQITRVSDRLVFIKWYDEPSGAEVEKQFLDEMQALLDGADQPIYFISDLRTGRIKNVDALRRLGELGRHKNFAAGTSFSGDVYTPLFVRLFAKFARRSDPFWNTSAEALAYLESLAPGITRGVDWDALIEGA